MKSEDILKCHQEIKNCLNAMAKGYAGKQLQVALYPEDDDPSIIYCRTKLVQDKGAFQSLAVASEDVAIEVCDRVGKTV